MHRFLRLFFLFCALSGSLGAAAWKRMGLEEGLSFLETRQVICLPSGQMLAVMGDLVDVYDGERWHRLELDRRQMVNIHSFLNTNHYFDQQERLWIRAMHQLIVIDARTLQQVDARALLANTGITGQVHNFFVDTDGTAWVHVGEDSLMMTPVGGETGTLAQLALRFDEQNPDGLRASVCDIVQVGRQHFIFFSNGHMVCRDAQTGKQIYATLLGDPSRGYYLRAKAAPDGQTMVVRLNDGEDRNVLARFSTSKRQVRDTLLTANITDFQFSSSGELWAMEGRRVWHFHQDGAPYPTMDDAPMDLQAFAIDEQDGLWCCTPANGIFYHSPMLQTIQYLSPSGREAFHHFLRLSDGRVLAATTRGLLISSDGLHWDTVPTTVGWNVARLFNGRQGLYLSTYNQGLILADSALKAKWTFDADDSPSMRNNVNLCFDLPDGRLLFNCRLNRLIAFDAATKDMDFITERLNDAVQTYRYIIDYLPVEGGWLMATQNGLFMLEWEKGDFRINTTRFAALADNPWSLKCNCLFSDRQGRIFLGTQNGLLRFDEQDGSLLRYSTADGLPSNCIQSITADKNGSLWVATVQGLCRLSLSTGEVLTLGREDGVKDNSFTERAAVCLDNGRMLFGTKHGLYTFHPDSLQLPHIALTPRLLSVRIAGREGFIAGSESLRLPHDQNFLTFTISPLNYAYATHTIYRYRLRGVDPDWVVVPNGGGKLEIAYTALPHGHYTLEVQAALQGQPWGQTMSADITICPPLWQTWWAYFIYIVLALAAIFYTRRSYLNKREMQRRINQLLREVETRKAAGGRSSAADGESPEIAEEIEENIEPEAREATIKPELTPDARRFLEKALKCIDRNMSNTEYSIEDFASDMAMERSTLYRRLQGFMGQRPLEFVRIIRLNRAAELLRTGKYSVTEVSELVGFNTPRYFSKYFRERFGCLPSEYR